MNFLSSSSNSNDQEFKQCAIKYIFTTIIFTIVCFILYNILNKSSNIHYTIQKYFFIYMFPLLMIFAILLNLNTNTTNRKPFLEIFGILVIFGISIYYYSLTNGYDLDITSWSNTIILIAIGLVGLAIVYNSLISYMSRLEGWPGFIAQLIFYLPCVLYDAWVYLLDQFKLTPFAIYGFIVIEIILMIVYIYLPSLTNVVTGIDNSVVLVKDVISLDSQKTIATSSILKTVPSKKQKEMGITKSFFPRNYCISLWVFINPQDPSNSAYSQESQILNYGHLDKDGIYQVKPLITYYGGGNTTDQPMERNKFVFYFVNYKDIHVEDEIKTLLSRIQNEINRTNEKTNTIDF